MNAQDVHSPVFHWSCIARMMRRHCIALMGLPAYSYVRPDLSCQPAANDGGVHAA